MLAAMMGHGMLGVVGHGALTGIEMCLWDIKGKALGVPVHQLLGGKMRSRVRCYAHGSSREEVNSSSPHPQDPHPILTSSP